MSPQTRIMGLKKRGPRRTLPRDLRGMVRRKLHGDLLVLEDEYLAARLKALIQGPKKTREKT